MTKTSMGFLGAGILALGIQLAPIGDRINPAVDAARTVQARSGVTPEVSSILDRSCADCHSNHTRWPWYSRVAPVSWFVAKHVQTGRKKLNLSDWQRTLDRGPGRAAHKLDEICGEVRKGKMPLKSYVVIHTDANLSSSDVEAVCGWAASEKRRISATASAGQPAAK